MNYNDNFYSLSSMIENIISNDIENNNNEEKEKEDNNEEKIDKDNNNNKDNFVDGKNININNIKKNII